MSPLPRNTSVERENSREHFRSCSSYSNQGLAVNKLSLFLLLPPCYFISSLKNRPAFNGSKLVTKSSTLGNVCVYCKTAKHNQQFSVANLAR